LAKEHSDYPVNLQTNAIRLSDPELARELAEAGLDEAFISLHGSTADISDAVTEAPGTHEKTLLGIDNIYAEGVRVLLNFVICERNREDIVPFVQLVARRWPEAFINISFVAPSTDLVPEEEALIPRYSMVLPHLAAAVREAHDHELSVGGFDSMCGIPLCLVPDSIDVYFHHTDIPEGYDAGEFVRTKTCETCALNRKCWGLRRGYLNLYGDSELRAVDP
jgi:hypothetical protein